MEYKDYYKILGVERNADQDAIRKAFRRLAAKYHPDRNKEADAEERFKEVNEANEVLSDPEKRTYYDQFGANWQQAANGGGFQQPPNWGHNGSFNFDPNDFIHMSGGFGRNAGGGASGFSDFFDTLFGGGGGFNPHAQHTQRQAPAAQTASLALSVEDVYQGVEKTIRLPNGSSVQVRIPAGTEDGKKLRLSGKGANGADLHLQIAIKEHPLYRLEGKDIYTTVNIMPWEAALGGSITVPTPGGNLALKIPADSQAGKKMRLKGRGLPGKTPGDLYAVLTIQVPVAHSEAQKAAYAQLRDAFSA